MQDISEAQIFKTVCENDFSFFVKSYLSVVEPETYFEWNWHIDTLCNYCERVYYGDYQNLDFNIPPRMMKSLIITVLFPCWVWTKDPSLKFIVACRSFELSEKYNQQRRDLIKSEAYSKVWPVIIRDDMDKAKRFVNYNGGFMQAASALGKITGAGADFLLSDDLLDAMDAFSRSKRKATNQWFSNAFYNRAQNKKTVKRININQRLHMEDVSGYIEENHNYHRLVLEMVKSENSQSTVDFVDPRKPGEFLFPARYGQAEMDDDFKGMGSYGWSSQYQQSPIPIGGGIIKKEWIRYWTVLPDKFDRKIITADLTFKGEDTSDYVSFMAWGEVQNKKYLISVVRGRWTYKVSKANFTEFCKTHGIDRKLIEDKANGPALISDLSEKLTGLIAWPEKGSPLAKLDKVSRLGLCSEAFELGEVYLPQNDEITEVFVDELTSFTENGSATGNDDMVDTATMALLEFKKSEEFFEA